MPADLAHIEYVYTFNRYHPTNALRDAALWDAVGAQSQEEYKEKIEKKNMSAKFIILSSRSRSLSCFFPFQTACLPVSRFATYFPRYCTKNAGGSFRYRAPYGRAECKLVRCPKNRDGGLQRYATQVSLLQTKRQRAGK